MDGLNDLLERRKAAVIYRHPKSSALHGFENAVVQ